MRTIIISFIYFLILTLTTSSLFAQENGNEKPFNFELKEIVVYQPYAFKDDSERKQYEQLKIDIEKIYPLIILVREEYSRINSELELYNGRQKRRYLKWSKNYVKDNYMSHLSGLNKRQGRLLLLMLSRELGSSPYDLIKNYLNGFHAMFWQMASHMFQANLKVEYKADNNPMIEHIMIQLDSNNYHSSLMKK